jgi:inorganic pyrophosphatase
MAGTVEFDVVVEVPKGSRNKYEMDQATGHILLDRPLYSSVRYPADYGFITETLSGDGDPLDALVLVDEPTFPGCRIRCRAIGVLRTRDQKGHDAKVLALPTFDIRDWNDLDDVPRDLKDEIEHFFSIYKDLDPDKFSHVEGWSGRARAEKEIDDARRRRQKQP